MLEQDRKPVVTICLLAAMADGSQSPEEEAEVRRLAARMGASDLEISAAALSNGTGLASAARELSTPETRKLAYEMALAVVYADGVASAPERAFLERLQAALEVDAASGDGLAASAAGLAVAPLDGLTSNLQADQSSQKSVFVSQGIPASSPEVALDNMIRKQALLTAALELLPQNIASLAIIPLQMRLVYRIGADYGHQLDAAQIRDLLGVLGIGAASQVLDGMARRIVGGLGRGIFGGVLGGVVGGTAAAAAGAGVTFVTTYALGHAARQYYHQGRRISPENLQALFLRFRQEAEGILPTVQEQIHLQSQHMDLAKLLASIRGQPSA